MADPSRANYRTLSHREGSGIFETVVYLQIRAQSSQSDFMTAGLFASRGIHPTRLAILCCLAQSRYPQSSADVRRYLNIIGYRRTDDAHMSLMQKMLTDGLVAASDPGGVKFYTLTAAGHQQMMEWLESADGIVRLWGSLLAAPAPRLSEPTHKDRTPINQRLPTEEELEKIMKLLSPFMVRPLRVYQATGRNPYHIIGMKIEDVNWTKRIALLPEKGAKVRKIKDRTIEITKELEPVFREAIGDRTEGYIFPTRRGKRWIRDRFSRAFRAARNRLGIPEEVLLSGRGGKLADEADDDGDDGED